MKEICSRCGEEVRAGVRHGVHGYWHREDVGHMPAFGRLLEDGGWEAITAAHHSRNGADANGDDKADASVIEDIEVYSTPIPHEKGPTAAIELADGSLSLTAKGKVRMQEVLELDSGRLAPIPGGARTMANTAKGAGFEIRRFTYARGPYLSAANKSLGVSDSVVLGVRSPAIDGAHWFGVASWRDGSLDWAWRISPAHTVESLSSTDLNRWMKEFPRGD